MEDLSLSNPFNSKQLLSGLGGLDTSAQMFGVVDEVAGSFEEQFASAKESQEGKTKQTLPVEKKTAEEPPDENQETVEDPAQDHEEKVAKPDVQLEEELKASSKAEEASLEDPNVPEEAKVLEKKPVEPTSNEKVEEKALAASSEETVEEASADTLSQDLNEPVQEEESIAAQEAPQEEVEVPEAKETLEELPPEPTQEANVEEEAETPKVAASPERPVQEKPVQEVAEDTLEKAPKVATPQPDQKPKKTMRQEALEASRAESQDEAIPDSFHSIEGEEEPTLAKQKPQDTPEKELPKETQKALQSLTQLMEATQVKPPVAEKLTARMVEGVKAAQVNNTSKEFASIKQQVTSQSTQQAAPRPTAKAPLPFEPKADVKPFEKLRARVVEQVRVQMKFLPKSETGKIKMQLKPQFLGNVNVEISIEGSKAKALFFVETQSVREVLQRSTNLLQDALKAQGIEASEIDVDIASDSNQDGYNGNPSTSAEDQKVAREWLRSFYRFEEGAHEEKSAEPDEAEASEDTLNIIA